MGFVSVVGRSLFSALFIISALQKINDFGHDGGAALKILKPKYGIFENHVRNSLGLEMPEFDMKQALMVIIGLEGIGGILFVFGRKLGAYLLLIFLAVVTPIVHDFYNYDTKRPEYVVEFIQFLKNMSLLGALLIFLGAKNSASRKPKKKGTKLKGN
uniref:DoxX family protein n=1 Tax=Araucaria cunninghamii TaxID=56994 RepID=A0A0D6R703_ARACU